MSSLAQDLTADSDDDLNDLLGSGPVFTRQTTTVSGVAVTPSAAAAPLNNVTNRRLAAAAAPPKKKKRKKSEQPHCLIWVCTHGKGQKRRGWRNQDLKLVGVYSSKQAAQKAKEVTMSQYDCCGHGDIIVGGSWSDEIDLVIRPAPMFLDEDAE